MQPASEISNTAFCLQSVFIVLVWFSESPAIIPVHSVNQLVIVMVIGCRLFGKDRMFKYEDDFKGLCGGAHVNCWYRKHRNWEINPGLVSLPSTKPTEISVPSPPWCSRTVSVSQECVVCTSGPQPFFTCGTSEFIRDTWQHTTVPPHEKGHESIHGHKYASASYSCPVCMEACEKKHVAWNCGWWPSARVYYEFLSRKLRHCPLLTNVHIYNFL
jgi:hypothetical protein